MQTNKTQYEIMPSESISRIESRINEVFSMAEICGWSSTKLNDTLMERVINPINYKTPAGKALKNSMIETKGISWLIA